MVSRRRKDREVEFCQANTEKSNEKQRKSIAGAVSETAGANLTAFYVGKTIETQQMRKKRAREQYMLFRRRKDREV